MASTRNTVQADICESDEDAFTMLIHGTYNCDEYILESGQSRKLCDNLITRYNIEKYESVDRPLLLTPESAPEFTRKVSTLDGFDHPSTEGHFSNCYSNLPPTVDGIFPILNTVARYACGLSTNKIMDHQAIIWDNKQHRDYIFDFRRSSYNSLRTLNQGNNKSDADVCLWDTSSTDSPSGSLPKYSNVSLSFHKFFASTRPHIANCSFRSLVCCVGANKIYYPSIQNGHDYSDPSIRCLNPTTGISELIFSPTSTNLDNVSNVRLSTMSCNDKYVVAGWSEGFLTLNSTIDGSFTYHRLKDGPTPDNSLESLSMSSILASKHISYSNDLLIASQFSWLSSYNFEKETYAYISQTDSPVNQICESPINGGHEVFFVDETTSGKIVDRRESTTGGSTNRFTSTKGHGDISTACAWSRGNVLATGSQDGTVRLYDRRNLSNEPYGVISIMGTGGAVREVRFDPTGRYLAFAEYIDNVYVVDLQTGLMEDQELVRKVNRAEDKRRSKRRRRSNNETQSRRSGIATTYIGLSEDDCFDGEEAEEPTSTINRIGNHLPSTHEDQQTISYKDTRKRRLYFENGLSQTLNYQQISAIGRISGLSFSGDEDDHSSQLLTIGVNDTLVGGILQYKLPSYTYQSSTDLFNSRYIF